jgi:putative tricarboxylic transport membrane protein
MAAALASASRINVIVGGLTVAVAALFWSQRSYTTQYGGTFADPIIIVLGLLGVLLLVLGLLGRRVGADTEELEQMPLRGLILAVVLLVAWTVALPFLGYLVGGILFFALMAVLMRTERPTVKEILLDVAIAAVVVGAFYLVFTEVLYVRLPEIAV